MAKTIKYTCAECEWCGPETELLQAQNPFADDIDTMVGCPNCREPNSMRRSCDEDGCSEVANCGTPTSAGYRMTCSRHQPEVAVLRSAAGGEQV